MVNGSLCIVADDYFRVGCALRRPCNVLQVHSVAVIVALALRVLFIIDAELGDLVGVSA